MGHSVMYLRMNICMYACMYPIPDVGPGQKKGPSYGGFFFFFLGHGPDRTDYLMYIHSKSSKVCAPSNGLAS
jgi:hypothetical protein